MRASKSVVMGVCLLAMPALGQNLLTNGDFEAGTLTGWTTYTTLGGAPAVHTGNHFGITPEQGSWFLDNVASFGNFDGGVYQQVALPAGTYRVTGFGQGYNNDQFVYIANQTEKFPDTTWAELRLDPAGGTDPSGAGVQNAGHVHGTSGWLASTQLTFTLNSPATVTVFGHLHASFSFAGNWAGLDDISLSDINSCPNPSTITGALPNSFSTPPDPGVQNVTFSGSVLDQIGSISLKHESGSPTLPGTIQSQNAGQIVAQFNFTGAPVGFYNATGTRTPPCSSALLSHAVQISCSAGSATVSGVANGRGLTGTSHTLQLTGTNLAGISAVKLVKTRNNNGSGPGSASNPINGTNLHMVGSNLSITFDLAGAEAGRYQVICTHPCNQVNNEALTSAFLVYVSTLTNASFEQAFDGTTGEDPCNGGGRNKPKPMHWDVSVSSNNGAYSRDGDVFFPDCNGTQTKGIDGKHYATRQFNGSDPQTDGIFQTIAAPGINQFNIRADFSIHGGTTALPDTAMLVLHDGAESDTVIASTPISSPWESDPGNGGLIADPSYNVVVPSGYTYTSSPPLLTIEIQFHNSGAGVNTFHGFAVDYVRTGGFSPPGCDPTIWADADHDGDVDHDDFGIFQRCYTGDSSEIPTIPEYTCSCFDRGAGDSKINDFDFNKFMACVSGPNVPWSLSVAPACEP